jgi:ferredoxin
MDGDEMKVRVDPDLCQGHTMCQSVAPELFKLREDDGHAYVVDPEVPTSYEEKARMAELGCPERAIQIER